jgi:hypothetical protein
MDQLISPEDPAQIFTLDEELAEGSFGVVYRFVHKILLNLTKRT